MSNKAKRTIDELLQTSYWIIDILPKQVPANGPGQYFDVAEFFSKEPHIDEIKQKHINLILKLNCYRDISLDEEETLNPPPERIDQEMRGRYLNIMVDRSRIISEPDDTHMTVFDPDDELLELIRDLASGEGLYVWQP